MIRADMHQEWLAYRAEQHRSQKRDAVKRVIAAEAKRQQDEKRRQDQRIERPRAVGEM